MTFAVSIGTMLLGGWVLSDVDPGDPINEPTPQAAAVVETEPEVPAGPARRESGGPTDRSAPYGYGTPRGYRSAQYDNGPQQPTMPLAPTDPALGGSESPWAAPTESSSGVLPGFGTPRAGSSGMSSPRNSRYGGSGSRNYGYSSYRNQMQPSAALMRTEHSEAAATSLQVDRLQPAAASGPGPIRKPFSGYNPGPAVSPYMNLYRRDSGPGVDNYTSLVRPQVEQSRQNQLFGGEIRGLQSAQHLQLNAMQRLGKVNPNRNTQPGAQPTNAPEYFMNHNGYFPAFSR